MPDFLDLPPAGALIGAVLPGLLAVVPWTAFPSLLDSPSGQLVPLARLAGAAPGLVTAWWWESSTQLSAMAVVARLTATGQVLHAVAQMGSAWFAQTVAESLQGSGAAPFVLIAAGLAAFAGIERRASDRRATSSAA